MYKNSSVKIACVVVCSMFIACDAMNVKKIISFVKKTIVQQQLRTYTKRSNKIRELYCPPLKGEREMDRDFNEKNVLIDAKMIYDELPFDEKSRLLYGLSYHGRGLRAVGDCKDCDEHCRHYSEVVHKELVKEYKKECKDLGEIYVFPGAYKYCEKE